MRLSRKEVAAASCFPQQASATMLATMQGHREKAQIWSCPHENYPLARETDVVTVNLAGPRSPNIRSNVILSVFLYEINV